MEIKQKCGCIDKEGEMILCQLHSKKFMEIMKFPEIK